MVDDGLRRGRWSANITHIERVLGPHSGAFGALETAYSAGTSWNLFFELMQHNSFKFGKICTDGAEMHLRHSETLGPACKLFWSGQV